MQMTAGQNVKKNNSPGPIGLGFGSGQRLLIFCAIKALGVFSKLFGMIF